jgi:hypothetical protein
MQLENLHMIHDTRIQPPYRTYRTHSLVPLVWDRIRKCGRNYLHITRAYASLSHWASSSPRLSRLLDRTLAPTGPHCVATSRRLGDDTISCSISQAASSTISGLSANVIAEGIGMTVLWNLCDKQSGIRWIVIPSFCIPQSQIRPFRPLCYFRHHDNNVSFSLNGTSAPPIHTNGSVVPLHAYRISFLPNAQPPYCPSRYISSGRKPVCISRGRESVRVPINVPGNPSRVTAPRTTTCLPTPSSTSGYSRAPRLP